MVQYQRATPASPLVPVASGGAATSAIFNCPGSGTQFVDFRMESSGFYSGANPAGDHVAVLTRATIDLSQPAYVGRGVALMRERGIIGELMRRDATTVTNVCQNGPGAVNGTVCDAATPRAHPIDFVDGDVYWASVHSAPGNIGYTAARQSTGQIINTPWQESYTHETLTGHQIAFAWVFAGNPAGKSFSVRIYNINAGWF